MLTEYEDMGDTESDGDRLGNGTARRHLERRSMKLILHPEERTPDSGGPSRRQRRPTPALLT
jgi:hypothetical protein